jgi:DNA-binding NtrC family response regulator
VDDDEDVRQVLSEIVEKTTRAKPVVASNGQEGLELFCTTAPADVVITDIRMPEMDGGALLKEIKRLDKNAVVVVVTGYPSVESAVQIIKDGAYDYIPKPLDMQTVEVVLQRALEKRELTRSLGVLKGVNWALILSVPFWLVLGIVIALLLK